MLRVIRNHRRAAYGMADGYDGLHIAPVPLDASPRPTRSWSSTPGAAWNRALALGEIHGFRNAQATVIAPTGTIGLIMDCDTTGIEPDFALVKFKKLAGGGYFKIINRAVPEALRASSATTSSRSPRRSSTTRSAAARSRDAPGINHEALRRGASPTRSSPPSRPASARPSTSSSPSTAGRSARPSAPPSASPRRRSNDPASTSSASSASRRRTSRRPTTLVLRDDDARGRAGPQGRAPAGVRLRQSLRPPSASATSRSRATSA
jgi:hypothetical protein